MFSFILSIIYQLTTCCVLGATITIVSAKGKIFGGVSNSVGSMGSFLWMLEPHIKLPCHERQKVNRSNERWGPVLGGEWGPVFIVISSACRSNSESHANAKNDHRSYGNWRQDQSFQSPGTLRGVRVRGILGEINSFYFGEAQFYLFVLVMPVPFHAFY